MQQTNKRLLTSILAALFVIFLGNFAYAQEATEHAEQAHEKEPFNPGTYIIEHIGDAYEWHIFTYHDHHVSLPLPIILYSEHTGFHFFMSSKFEHGHKKHDGFHIDQRAGATKGKILETLSDSTLERPWDISITKNTLSLLLSLIFLLWLFISIANAYKRNKDKAPKGMQSLLEPLILFIRDDIAKASIAHHAEKYIPYLLSIFFFIFFNNLFGLIPIIPGGANLTGNIAVTMVLAVFTFIITSVNANKGYWKHLIDAPGVPWWLKFPLPLMPLVEIMGIFIKPFVLMIRLFANITAGHIIALGFFSLIFIFGNLNMYAGYGISILSIAFTVFMTVLEFLVAFIQAYVFTLLSALYFGMATEESH